MNPTLELIARRRSLRAYAERPLDPDHRQAILEAAFRAPTAGNMMLYALIEIDDPTLKATLAETCDHQPFIAKAPLLLLFAADYQRWHDFYAQAGLEARCQALGRPYHTPREGDLFLAMSDALIAAQNAVLAAESLGVGSCYIGDIIEQYEIHRDLLHLPRYVFPAALVCFGYPRSEAAPGEPTPRWYRQQVYHHNTYTRLAGPALTEMMRPVQERFYPDGQLPGEAHSMAEFQYLRKLGADFTLELNRSARLWLQHWQED